MKGSTKLVKSSLAAPRPRLPQCSHTVVPMHLTAPLVSAFYHPSRRRNQSSWAAVFSAAQHVFNNAPDPKSPIAVDPFQTVAKEMKFLTENIRQLLGSGHPTLDTVAKYYTQSEGKYVRPMLVLLMSRATALTPKRCLQNNIQKAESMDQPHISLRHPFRREPFCTWILTTYIYSQRCCLRPRRFRNIAVTTATSRDH
jgi:hexaprenyl-diphosphate synthase